MTPTADVNPLLENCLNKLWVTFSQIPQTRHFCILNTTFYLKPKGKLPFIKHNYVINILQLR